MKPRNPSISDILMDTTPLKSGTEMQNKVCQIALSLHACAKSALMVLALKE
jgi:hypothetical protein